MARLPRLTLPQYPHHVIQRGNNRQVVFTDAEDFEKFLALLAEHSVKNQVQVHAYVAMPNHFHLLVTPASEEGLPKMMQSVGRAYAQYFNKRHQRTGTLWEGRYRTGYIQDVPYVLHAYVWLDGMSEHSSRAQHLGHYAHSFLREHAQYWQLGNTPFERQTRYAQLLEQGITQNTRKALEHAVQTGWMLGDDALLAQVEEQTGRRVRPAARGRPRKPNAPD